MMASAGHLQLLPVPATPEKRASVETAAGQDGTPLRVLETDRVSLTTTTLGKDYIDL